MFLADLPRTAPADWQLMRVTGEAWLPDLVSQEAANNVRKVAQFYRPILKSKLFKSSTNDVVSLTGATASSLPSSCPIIQACLAAWWPGSPFRMITWAAPKFSSQASQFVPVPPQKPHTYFRLGPTGLAYRLCDSTDRLRIRWVCLRPIHCSLTTGISWYLFWRISTCYRSCILHSCMFLSRIRLRNDLYCVEWGVKLYSLTHSPPAFSAPPYQMSVKCQTPSKRRTDGRTDAAYIIRGVCPSVRRSLGWSLTLTLYHFLLSASA